MSSDENTAVLKRVASIVRALINSRKPPYYLRDVLEEYYKVENEVFPYRECGYKTAQEMLEKTGDFLFNSDHGEIIITVKHSNKSVHIANMVRNQKGSRHSRMNKREESMRRPSQHFASVANCLNSRRNNHYSGAKNNQLSNREQKQQHEYHQEEDNPSTSAALPSPNQQQSSSNKGGSSNGGSGGATAAYMQDNRDTKNESLQITQSNKHFRPILGALKITNNIQLNGGCCLAAANSFAKPQNHFQRNPKSFVFRNMPNSYNNNNKLQPAIGIQTISCQQDSIKTLSEYCLEHDIPPPEYKIVTTKYPKLSYSCRVKVNNAIFSTYPIEYDSEHLAKEMCSKRALEKIILDDMKTPLPLSTFTDTEILNKLHEELLTHAHGMFLKNIPEWFENKFLQSLPGHWADLIQTSKQFITETGLNEKVIVFVNSEAGETLGSENSEKDIEAKTIREESSKTPAIPATEALTRVANSLMASNYAKMSPLAPPFVPSSKSPSIPQAMQSICFPWMEKYWNIFITYCVSTVEVWGRLFGSDYSDRFNDLMIDIEDCMVFTKEHPLYIVRKTIYLACLSESWYRVRVEELDNTKDSALCYFIDFGDADWLEINQLYICKSKFLELPAQAVVFSLYGLEDFADHPGARKPLDDLLLTKSFVGLIFSKESEFSVSAADDTTMAKIQVVLFDTSTQEDINLNHQLVQLICDDVSLVPQIKADTVNNVKITHICDNGDIYVQLMHNELKYIQKVIEQIVSVKLRANADEDLITFKDLMPFRLFLVCQDNDNVVIADNKVATSRMLLKKCWYRGAFVENSYRLSDNTCDMFDVDFGITQRTHLSKIYNLERLSIALSKFPRLAIKVALYNIPDVTNDIAARIRSLLPKDCEALIKLNEKSPVKPLVTIYSHLEGSCALCTINDIINIEYLLKQDEKGKIENSNSMKNLSNHKGIVANGIKGLPKTGSSPNTSYNESILTKTRKAFVNQSPRNMTMQIPPTPQAVGQCLPKLKEYHKIPNVGEYFQVRVTLSVTPSNFTIQPYKEYPRLKTLMEELQDYCKSNNELMPIEMIKVGEYYAAKNPDGLYHRAMVVKIYGGSSGGGGGNMIQVFFCDFGDTATVANGQLKILPHKFRQLPQMALACRLHGIRAAKDDWTLEDCMYFRKLTVGQTFVSFIRRLVNEPTTDEKTTCRILELELIDVSTEDDVFINELLLKEKRAVRYI